MLGMIKKKLHNDFIKISVLHEAPSQSYPRSTSPTLPQESDRNEKTNIWPARPTARVSATIVYIFFNNGILTYCCTAVDHVIFKRVCKQTVDTSSQRNEKSIKNWKSEARKHKYPVSFHSVPFFIIDIHTPAIFIDIYLLYSLRNWHVKTPDDNVSFYWKLGLSHLELPRGKTIKML